MYEPTKIIYNGVATIVFWNDGTKTVVKRAADQQDDKYGAFCAALAIKTYGSNSALKRTIKRGEEGKEQTYKTYLGQAVDCIQIVKDHDYATKTLELTPDWMKELQGERPMIIFKKDGRYEFHGLWTLENLSRQTSALQCREAYRKARNSQMGGIF